MNACKNIIQKHFRILFCVLLSICIILMVLVVAFLWSTAEDTNKKASEFDFAIHIVDVGQGDAIVVVLPTNEVLMIDAGPLASNRALMQYFDSMIRINKNKIDKIDYAILTHPDEDHCGGMSEVLSKYAVRYFFRPNVVATNSVDKNFIDLGYINQDTSQLHKTNSYSYSRTIDSVYQHSESVLINSDTPHKLVGHTSNENNKWSVEIYPFGSKQMVGSVDNNYSPIIILECRQQKFVFCGDADGKVLNLFMEMQKNKGIWGLQANFVMLGHHGSNKDGTNSQEFLSFVLGDNIDSQVIGHNQSLVDKKENKIMENIQYQKSNKFTNKIIKSNDLVNNQNIAHSHYFNNFEYINKDNFLLEKMQTTSNTITSDKQILSHHQNIQQGIQRNKMVAISVGKNQYGHPSAEVLANLQQVGVGENDIYRTDYDGNIIVGIKFDYNLFVQTIRLQSEQKIVIMIAKVGLMLFTIFFGVLCMSSFIYFYNKKN